MKILIPFLLFISVAIQAVSQPKKTKQLREEKPFVLGLIDEIQSEKLGEKRTLNIYLPAGYDKNDTVKYPVIYLLDGSADEDFIHVAGLVQFYSFPWINRLPESIVVGIANTDRRRDFTFPTTLEADNKRFNTSGNSGKFIAFIESELQPYIEKKYKTAKNKTLIGQSLGGLLATEILFNKPTLFQNYIIISPSIWWDNGSLLTKKPAVLTEAFTQKTAVYIGVGKEGLAPNNLPRVMEVDANLLAEKLRAAKSPGLKVFFDYLPEEDHATISHQAVSNAFKRLHPVSDKN